MGVVGGLLGALFNCMNRKLAKYRIRHIHPKAKFIRWLLATSPPMQGTSHHDCQSIKCQCNCHEYQLVVWPKIFENVTYLLSSVWWEELILSIHFSRVLESLLVSMVTTVVIFAASILLGECRDLSAPTTHNTTVNISSFLRENTYAQWTKPSFHVQSSVNEIEFWKAEVITVPTMNMQLM